MSTQLKQTNDIQQVTTTTRTTMEAARSMMMTMRSAVAPVAEEGFIRNEYVIIIDQYGHVDEPNIDLGILGDNKVTKLRFEMHHDWNNATSSDYDVKLFIYNKQLPLGINNPKAITPEEYGIYDATFILENNYFNGGGTYELIYSVIEKDADNNNISTEREVFISDIITGTLTDVGIPTNFMELITAIEPAGEETFFNYVEKPYLEINNTNQVAYITGEVNINKMDAYTTPIVYMMYMPEYFTNWYLVYRTPDSRTGAIEFNTEMAGGRFTWAPKEWGYAAGEVSAWVVSMSTANEATYITNKLSFTVKDNFLSATDFETSVYDSGDSAINEVSDKPVVTNESIGGYHKIKYSGEELDEWLDYVAALFEKDAIGVITGLQNDVSTLKNVVSSNTNQIYDIRQDLSFVVIEPIPDNWAFKSLSLNNLSDPTKPTYHYLMSIDGDSIGALSYDPSQLNNNYGGWSLGGGAPMDVMFSYDINTKVLRYIYGDNKPTLSYWSDLEVADDALPIIAEQNIKPKDIYNELQNTYTELQEFKSEINTAPATIAISVEPMLEYGFYQYYSNLHDIDFSYYNTTIEKGLAEFEFIADSGLQIKCRGYISNFDFVAGYYRFTFDVKYMSIDGDTNSEFAILGSYTVHVGSSEMGFGPWMVENLLGWKPIESLENPSYRKNHLVLGHALLLE